MILRGRIIFAAVAVPVVILALPALAEPLQLSKRENWLVVANTSDPDAAIGIAHHYADATPRVVMSENGSYAVLMGPYKSRSIQDISSRHALPALPPDARLSRGQEYRETVWQKGKTDLAHLNTYAPGRPWRARDKSGLNVVVKFAGKKRGEAAGQTIAIATLSGKQLFSFTVGSTSDAPVLARATLLRLDPETEFPQLVFTRYSGENHCCTKTWIATKPRGSESWILLEGEGLDGDGLGFIDLDNDGVFETAQTDNNFLYMFDSYDRSYSPVIYQTLRGDQVVDVSTTPIAVRAARQDLAYIEFAAKLDPTNWKHNGFLAGWVASKVRLGQGDEAWMTMLENFDRSLEFAQMECTNGLDVETCPAEQLTSIPFPQALLRLLQLTGYGPLPQAAVSSNTN
jgi:serine protease Do